MGGQKGEPRGCQIVMISFKEIPHKDDFSLPEKFTAQTIETNLLETVVGNEA